MEGYEGGREAARQVVTLSRSCLKLSPSTRLLVQVFANVSGLGYILMQFGLISKQEIFHEFVNGFNSVDELVTFINVGRGKELTDSKINGTFNTQCSSGDGIVDIRSDENVCRSAAVRKSYPWRKS